MSGLLLTESGFIKRKFIYLILFFICLAQTGCLLDSNSKNNSPPVLQSFSFHAPPGEVNVLEELNSTLFAGTASGLFRSNDGGATWDALTAVSGAIHSLAIARDAQHLYVATSNGLFASSDSGLTWTKTGLTASSPGVVLVEPAAYARVYVTIPQQGVWRSIDSGVHWAPTALNNSLVTDLALDTGIPQMLYASTNDAVYTTKDNGDHWSTLGPLNHSFQSLSLPGSGLIVAAGPDGLVVHHPGETSWRNLKSQGAIQAITSIASSTDSAKTTQLVYASTTGLYRLALSEDSPAVQLGLPVPLAASTHQVITTTHGLFVATSAGLYRSIDGGISWLTANKGLPEAQNFSLLAATSDGATIFAQTPGGLFKRRREEDWQVACAGLPAGGIKALTFAQTGQIYAGTEQGVYLLSSTDAASWESFGLNQFGISALTVTNNGLVALVATGNDALVYYKGTISEAWAVATSGLPLQLMPHTLYYDQATKLLFLGTAAQVAQPFTSPLFISSDAGAHWVAAAQGLNPRSSIIGIKADPALPGHLTIATSEGVYSTTDPFQQWTLSNNGIPPHLNCTSLLVSPEGLLYVLAGSLLYTSNDGGISWQSSSLPASATASLILPGSTSLLIATNAQPLARFTPPLTAVVRPTGPVYIAQATSTLTDLASTSVANLPPVQSTVLPGSTVTPGGTGNAPTPADPVPAPPDDSDTTTSRYFKTTNHYLRFAFKAFWEAHDGANVFGDPLTEEFTENNLTVQYFANSRLEYHPEANGDSQVQIGQLGREFLGKRFVLISRYFPTTAQAVYFPATQHSLRFGFLDYWNAHGGLGVFGYPISEEIKDNDLTVQYFERARLEYHPENAGGSTIIISPLGQKTLQARGWLH